MRRVHRRLGLVVTVASALVASSAAYAIPALASTATGISSGTAAHAQPTAGHPDFSGIVALNGCSGSIVRWQSSEPGDLAMMLTNGHCTKFYGAHEVQVNKPLVRDVTLLNADGSDDAHVSTTTLLYGTMSRTDVSLYQLSLTYAQLVKQYAVPALTISDQRAGATDKVVIISGYWKRAYRCHLNGFVYQLDEYRWTWDHSLRYNDNGCHTIGGTSGSPVLDPTTREVVGINNTGNEDGERCTLNNPCEVDRHGHVSVHLNRNYGQQTWWFTTCLAADRSLDLSKPGCLLPQP